MFICLCSPSVCGGRGHTLTTPPAPHPTVPHPHPLTPTSTTPPPPTPPVWMKYWALEIINDKWSNCGSDDSLCKYWRKNSYHLILIIFLLSHIKQVGLLVNMEQCVQKDINSVFSFPRRHLVCLMWCLRISTMEWCQWCWLKYTDRCKNVRLESQSKWERGTDSKEIRTERHMVKREGHKSD